jgi:hypothetical protein
MTNAYLKITTGSEIPWIDAHPGTALKNILNQNQTL